MVNVDWWGLEMGYAKTFLQELNRRLSGDVAMHSTVSAHVEDNGSQITYSLKSKHFANGGYSVTIEYDRVNSYKPVKIGDDFYVDREKFYRVLGLNVLRITYYCDKIKGIDIIDAGLGITPKVGAAFADLNVTCGASENYKEDVIIEQVRIKEGTAYTYGGYTPKMIAIASSVRTVFGVSKGEIVSTLLILQEQQWMEFISFMRQFQGQKSLDKMKKMLLRVWNFYIKGIHLSLR